MRYLLGVLVLLGVVVSGCTAPPSATTYTEPELKYLLLDHYGEDRFFFCDPDGTGRIDFADVGWLCANL